MIPALELHGLCKKYSGFTLENISFSVPSGAITGLIGENGAGKSTTIGAILGLIQQDCGSIKIFGKDAGLLYCADKEQIGVVFDGSNFSEELTPARLNKVLKEVYPSWDEPLYWQTLERMQVPLRQKIKSFSKGMKMKLSITAAFAHHPRLLILDEATSGLDPVMRDDILDLFLEFVQDESHSVLLSSHITSDLEKIADYIVFIHQGKLVFSRPKDELLENYGILKCGAAQLEALDKEDITACRRQDYEWQVLVKDRKKAARKYPKALITPADIDEIMLLYVKGEPI